MASLRIDAAQRFTCSQCGRCCRRPWEIVVTPSEADSYRKHGAKRWYRERAAGPEGTSRDPFERISGTRGFHRIRKRDDGACGFLSPENRCRLHEELGGPRKPLTCRMFPYRFHPVEQQVVVSTSFCCPTTIANEGEAVADQIREIQALRAEWFAVYPEKPARPSFAAGRPIDAATLGVLREVLLKMLDRPGPDGRPDLRANLLRMGHTLEDLDRHRVRKLKDEAFAEYLALTGRYAAATEKPVAERGPSWVGRLLRRGFLFVVAATRLQAENRGAGGLRLGLRLRLLRLLAHFHGLGPGVSGIDLRAAGRGGAVLEREEVQAVARHYLRSCLEGLGTGKRPALDELAIGVSYLHAALDLAAMRASQTGKPVDGPLFAEALMEAVDLTHADDRGFVGRMLGTLAAGPEAFFALAEARSPARP